MTRRAPAPVRSGRAWWRTLGRGGLALAVAVPFAAADARDGFDRLRTLVERHAPETARPDLAGLRRLCAGDLRCAAEKVVEAWPAGARLEAVPEADPQLIRAGVVPRSVVSVRRVRPGTLRIRLDRFGRRAGAQARRALDALRPEETLELDLRRHRGGSVSRMLEVAALFVGPRARAMRIVGHGDVEVLGVPAPPRPAAVADLDVLIGPETRSSAEVLAALLHRYAGARLVGERTFGKNWAERPLKVGSGWYLMVRAGEIRVDGEVLEGGLVPDAPPES